MSFGQKILEKYGYKEGEGLGKQRNGIVQPIKASFKFDNSGLGDKGPVKEDHWWERVFNEASDNINLKSDAGEVSIDLNDKDGVEITNKSYSMKKLMKSNNKLQYGNFLKSATLLANKGEEKDIKGHLSTTDIEIKPFQVLSDEDLLKACDYRTAHKGARHGLKLSGKLQRIAEQEKALLEKLKTQNQNKSEIFKQPNEQSSPSKKPKKRPLMELNSSKDESSDEDKLPINLESTHVVTKKAKKRQKKQVNILVDIIDTIDLDKKQSQDSLPKPSSSIVHPPTPYRKKKKDKQKKCDADLDKIVEEIEQACTSNSTDTNESKKSKKNKKKAKKRTLLDDDETMVPLETVEDPVNDTQKPKRAKLDESIGTSESEQDIDNLNEMHHKNLRLKMSKSSEPNDNSLESSTKKKKKDKKKTKMIFTDDNKWSIKNHKKIAKYEYKKQKYQHKLEQQLKPKRHEEKKLKKARKIENNILNELSEKISEGISL